MEKPQRNQFTDHEWRQGNLRWLLRPHGQTWMHQFILDAQLQDDTADPIVANCHRRMGKSFLFVELATEDCLQKPGQFVEFICGTFEQVEDIVVPLIDQILETCPPDIFPKRSGLKWTFRNPRLWGSETAYSTLKLLGANYKKGNRTRGTACDRAYIDEAREFENLAYYIENVLVYKFSGRESPRLVMTSTPPSSMDHDFTRPTSGFIPRAMQADRYLVIPGSKNPDFTERDKKIIRQSIHGGEDSIAWRREVECELISDPEDLITPEFAERKALIKVPSYPRPEYFFPWICLESGFDPDPTAFLAGYVDWGAHLFIIEGEHFERRMSTRDIAKADHDLVEKLGYDKLPHPIRRVADIDERGLADLRKEHRLGYRPVAKFNAESAVASLRSVIQKGNLRVIEPNCPQLCYQLEHGIYNQAKTDYERTETMGHWDLGKCLVYLQRMVSWGQNPNKVEPLSRYTHFYEHGRRPQEGVEHPIQIALGRRKIF